MSTAPRQVVVTGMGVVNPLGFNEEDLWKGMLAGKTAIRRIDAFDISDYKCPNGAQVDAEALKTELKAAGIRPVDRAVDMAMLASQKALIQAGLPVGDEARPMNCAVILGTGVGSTTSYYNAFSTFFEKGVKGLRPTSVPRCMANAVSSQISLRFRLTGPNYVIVSACSSSTAAIGVAYRMIRDGYIDMALCGGTDSVFDPFVYAGWNNLGVMSRNPDPARSCRPFDRDRDGCVLGEGAAVFLLESADSAAARGAIGRAEIAGYGESSDAHHITAPSPAGQTEAMRSALKSAGVSPSELGLVNAHGTATVANDKCECESIASVLGEAVGSVPVISNKSFFGHMLGAAGAAETAVTVLAVEKRLIPPNLNLDNPDPECNLSFVATDSIRSDIGAAMKNSFGFGGNNAVLIIRKWGR